MNTPEFHSSVHERKYWLLCTASSSVPYKECNGLCNMQLGSVRFSFNLRSSIVSSYVHNSITDLPEGCLLFMMSQTEPQWYLKGRCHPSGELFHCYARLSTAKPLSSFLVSWAWRRWGQVCSQFCCSASVWGGIAGSSFEDWVVHSSCLPRLQASLQTCYIRSHKTRDIDEASILVYSMDKNV